MKAKLKDGWVPVWQRNWNNRNLHKVNGKMIIKDRPNPLYDPKTSNHDRMLIRRRIVS